MIDPVKRCAKELTAEGGITLTSALFEEQMPWLYIALNDKSTTEKQLLASVHVLLIKVKKNWKAVRFQRSIPKGSSRNLERSHDESKEVYVSGLQT